MRPRRERSIRVETRRYIRRNLDYGILPVWNIEKRMTNRFPLRFFRTVGKSKFVDVLDKIKIPQRSGGVSKKRSSMEFISYIHPIVPVNSSLNVSLKSQRHSDTRTVINHFYEHTFIIWNFDEIEVYI